MDKRQQTTDPTYPISFPWLRGNKKISKFTTVVIFSDQNSIHVVALNSIHNTYNIASLTCIFILWRNKKLQSTAPSDVLHLSTKKLSVLAVGTIYMALTNILSHHHFLVPQFLSRTLDVHLLSFT